MVSSSILGVPRTTSSMNESIFESGNPCWDANCLVWFDQTRIFDILRFSPPNAFAKTTPVLTRSISFDSPSKPASSIASADTATAHCWQISI